MRNEQVFKRWVRFLRAAGIPAAHSAFMLDRDIADVLAIPTRPEGYNGRLVAPRLVRVGPNGRNVGPIRGPNATKLYRMRSLGYSVEEMARVLRCEARQISDFLRRITADDGSLLAKPRTQKEQRTVDLNRERQATEAAARIAAKAAAWPSVADARLDPAPELVAPPPAALVVAELLELELTEVAPPPVEPNYWADIGDLRRPFDAPSARPPAPPPARADEPAAPPSPPSPKPKRKPRQARNRWRVQGDRRRTDPDRDESAPTVGPLPPAGQVVAELLELPTEAPPPPPIEPHRWDGPLIHGNAKLSPRDIKRIRWLAASGFPLRQIALQFEISQNWAARIVRGKAYAEPLPSPADGMGSTSTG